MSETPTLQGTPSRGAAPSLADQPQPMKRKWFFVLAPLLIGVAMGGWAWYWNTQRPPKRFAPVVAGQLYRSGEVSPAQLGQLREKYGIRHVICLLNPDAPETQEERRAAERLGIQWHNVPLPGNGASTPAERARILALFDKTADAPTLVHCAAGTNRTGLAVGLYRLHKQGWTLEQVMEELKRFDFENEPQHQNLRDALAEAAAGVAASRPHP